MRLEANFNLTPLHTMGLISHAQLGAQVTSTEQIEYLLKEAQSANLPLHIIGGGSNLLPREKVNAVVGIMATKGREITGHGNGHKLVTAQAGEDWSAFVEWTIFQGLWGLENLAGIPGTVGAAPIQNIGAYGVELADRFYSLTVYDTVEHGIRTFNREECQFAYRQSIFKKDSNRFIVLDVTLALPESWKPVLNYAGLDTLAADVDAATVMDHVLKLRREKLPDWHILSNAGSFFHNPVVTSEAADKIPGVPRFSQQDGTVKLSAAWLIDTCGFKGYREGPVGVYEKHALILVNYGGATYSDIRILASKITNAVSQRFNITLTQEPLLL